MNDLTRSESVSGPYWEGMAAGEIRLQQCSACKRYRHYPQLLCPHCHSWDWVAVPVDGRGEVHSWTVVHVTFVPEDPQPTPYALVTVQLPQGVRVLARMSDTQGLVLGRAVQVTPMEVEGRKPALVAELR